MLKHLITLLTFVSAFLTVTAQELVLNKSNLHYVPAETENQDLIGLTNGIPDSGYGYPKDMELTAGVELSPEYLEAYSGKSIKMVRFFIGMELPDVTAFVRLDSLKGEIVSSVKLEKSTYGWNNVWLDTPYDIPEGKTLFLGYEFSLPAEGGFPMIVDKAEYIKGGCWLRLKGYDQGYNLDITKEYPTEGNLMIQGLVGSEECLNNVLALSNVGYNNTFNIADEQEIKLLVHNFGLNDISTAKIEYEVEGRKEEQTLTLSQTLAPTQSNSQNSIKVKFTKPVSKGEMKITVTEVNGQKNMSPANSLTILYDAYDNTVTVPRTVLIEKHTGQWCMYCPEATKHIEATIKGYEDRVALIEHHTYNYNQNPDQFCLRESGYYAGFFETQGAAPYMLMDRYPNQDQDIIYSPSYLTTEMLEEELARPAFVTVNIENSYENNKINVTVKGKRTMPLNGKRVGVTVIVTQSGYDAPQTNGDDNFRHNNFPIYFLTDYRGDEVTFDENGEYEMTFSKSVRKQLTTMGGEINTDPTKMKVIAFVNNWDTKDNSEVFNTAFANVNIGGAIAETETSFTLAQQDGTVTVSGEYDKMEIFDIAGRPAQNGHLAKGMYIVKVYAGGKAFTQKIMVD